MGRYDFVDPYVAPNMMEHVGATLNDVLEAERLRRAELEQKRRFDEQNATQKGYLGLAGKKDYREGVTSGFDPATNVWNPDQSAEARAQVRGAGLQRGTMQFGDIIDQGKEGRMRGYQAEDRGRQQGYFRDMGFTAPGEAGALNEQFPQYEYLKGPSQPTKDWEKEMLDIRGRWATRAAAANRSGSDAADALWRRMGGLRSRIDDVGAEQQFLEKQPVPTRDYSNNVPGTAAFDKFTGDSTSIMGGRERRINSLMTQRRTLGVQHDVLTEGALGLPEGTLVPRSEYQPGPWREGLRPHSGYPLPPAAGPGPAAGPARPRGRPLPATVNQDRLKSDAKYRNWLKTQGYEVP